MIIYKFGNYAPDIFADINGNFFECITQKTLKKKYYNGRVCIDFKGKRYGLRSLRKHAVKLGIQKTIKCPF